MISPKNTCPAIAVELSLFGSTTAEDNGPGFAVRRRSNRQSPYLDAIIGVGVIPLCEDPNFALCLIDAILNRC